MSVSTVNQLRDLFRAKGVRTIYVKRLAPNQDNEKNQIVLASELSGLINLFPAKLSLRAPSESELKRKSNAGQPITAAQLNFYWLRADGERFHAPGTKLIEYFQYPEARLSGFLQGCEWAPRAIRRDHQDEYGLRIMALGSNAAGEVHALLMTERDDPVVRIFPNLPGSGVSSVLGVMTTESDLLETPGEILSGKLRRIIAQGWHDSVRNKGGTIIPFNGNQGAGYTLEALLGVETNALKEPDILGYEVKSYRGCKISLMTPTADGGPEGYLSFREFMAEYGVPAKKKDGSLRFTGVVRAGRVSSARGLSLRVTGYDAEKDRFSINPDEIAVEQYFAASGELLSSWSLAKLAEGWNRKHAFAVYIPAEKRPDDEPGGDAYRFLSPFYLCEGTDVFRLFRAIATGHVYYDPAHTIYAGGEQKVRPQWRVSTTRFEDTLRLLYRKVEAVS